MTATEKKTRRSGSRGWFTRGRLIGAAAVTGALVLAGGGIAWANVAGAAGGYRTATATIGSVDETLTVNGALASATRRDRAFAASGTVDAVNVAVGDRVEAGDVLATIDPSDLQDAVDQAESKVADAKQTLASDLASQTSSSSASDDADSGDASTDAGGGAAGPGDGSTVDPKVAAALAKVVAAQQSLLALGQASADALAASEGSAASAATVCAPFLAATLDDGTVEPSEPAGGDGTETGSGSEGEPTDTPTPLTLEAVQQLLAECQAAMTGVGDAQSVVASAQTAVQAGIADLDAAVTGLRDAVAASGADSGSTTGSASGSTPASSGSTSPTSGGGSSGGSAASAADIVADQAVIAVAEADLAIAEHELQAAQLTTPVAGTVASVGFAVGDAVSAGSTTQVITVIGDDGYTVEATVTLAQIAKIEAGQTGTAVITSSGASYAATVSTVGFVNVSETSTPAYTIEIAVDPDGATLLNGAATEVAIDLAAASDVLTVPLSALHVDGIAYSVQVLTDGEPVSTPVEVGAIGSESVEITSGLSAGDVVVIADLGADITSDDTSTTGFDRPTFIAE